MERWRRSRGSVCVCVGGEGKKIANDCVLLQWRRRRREITRTRKRTKARRWREDMRRMRRIRVSEDKRGRKSGVKDEGGEKE